MKTLEKEIIKKEFDTIKQKVKYLLEVDEESRNSDSRLFCRFLHEYTQYRIIDISEIKNLIKIDAKDILSSFDVDKIVGKIVKIINQEITKTPSLRLFPNLETVRRNRQKIQNQDELFIPTIQEIAEKRNIRAELIRDYFIEQNKIEG